jgi:ribosome-associated translation inhibitor RaiA
LIAVNMGRGAARNNGRVQATQITLRNLRRSTALQRRIRDLRDHLDRYHPRIISCRVTLEESTPKPHGGRVFTVTVAVRVPGHEFISNHQHDEDVYLALHQSFDAVRRQLIDVSGYSRSTRQRLLRRVRDNVNNTSDAAVHEG